MAQILGQDVAKDMLELEIVHLLRSLKNNRSSIDAEVPRHVAIAQYHGKYVDSENRKERSSGGGVLRNFDAGGKLRQPRDVERKALGMHFDVCKFHGCHR